jgi:hypothetical protein
MEGNTLLKFIYGQLYNGKIAKRYGHAPSDVCPLCYMPDSCTHIAGECPAHEALRIARHNAACQLIHAAIRKSAKGGAALHSAGDMILVAADTGTLPQTKAEVLHNLTLSAQQASPQEEHISAGDNSHRDWLDIPNVLHNRSRRLTDVSQELRYTRAYTTAGEGDAECTAAPRRIPEWILSQAEVQELHAAGHGTAPDLIYARGVPDTPYPDPSNFNKRLCILVIIEIGFCRDLGCDDKREAKTAKYAALIAALKKHWGHVEFIAFPIGHAGTTLTSTLTQLISTLSAVRPHAEPSRASRGINSPTTDHNAKAHDSILFKSLLDSLTDLAQSRLIGIIGNRKRRIALLSGNSSSTRAYSAADISHTQAVTQQETATHTYRTRTLRVPESTAII